jgi:indole-3-glycerol phosphate synthase
MNILETIVAHKKTEIARRKIEKPASGFSDSPFTRRECVSLKSALGRGTRIGVIAEVKRGSPSAGLFAPGADAAAVAAGYAANGAVAISVLTDKRFFFGSLEDLSSVRRAATIPVLRKDFIIDPYQIGEAKAGGADAVLLIAAILDKHHLSDLQAAAEEAGLETLVELYESKEIDTIDLDRMTTIGVNNRDLRTFSVNIQRSIEIAALLPDGITLVSESGISAGGQLRELRRHGMDGALIGELFMKTPDPGESLRRLLQEYETESQG